MKANGAKLIFSAALTLALTSASYAADHAWASPYNTKSALIGRGTFVVSAQQTATPALAHNYSTKSVTPQSAAIDKDGLVHDADTYNTKFAVRGQTVEEVGVAVVK